MAEFTNYREVIRELDKVSPALAKALKRDLRTYAGEIAAVARANAGSRGLASVVSQIVPASTNSYAGVRVKGVLGPLMELGSSGNSSTSGWQKLSRWFGFARVPKTSGTVRHPLFGNRDAWYAMPTRPFLAPAIEETAGTALAKMDRSVDAAVKAAGF